MDSRQTDDLVKKVIGMTGQEQRKFMPGRCKRGILLALCALTGCLEVGLMARWGIPMEEVAVALFTVMGLMAGFGLYFCVFARERLPQYYDENKIDAFSDGPLRMNMPGIHFNNRNWPHIVRAAQLWAMIGLSVSPAFYFLMRTCFPGFWSTAGVYVILVLTLGGLFIPMYIVGRRYEQADGKPKPIGKALCVALAVLLAILLAGSVFGLSSRGSDLRVGYADSFHGDTWEARYMLFTGYRERSVNIRGGAATLHVAVTTNGGSFGLRVTDMEWNTLYEETFADSRSFDIEIPGKVTVRVMGEGHGGSYSISWRQEADGK